MTLMLVEVAGANFRTDEKSDELNTAFMRRLGMGKRYLPARLAITRSLAISTPPPSLPDGSDFGKTIKGDTLFGTGTELSVWLSLIVESSERSIVSIKDLNAFVGAHWGRGIKLLDEEWEQAGKNYSQFVKGLVRVANLPQTGGGIRRSGQHPEETHSSGEISILVGEIGEEVATHQQVYWNINGQGGSPHSAIMGGVGSGKTRTAVAMLRSLRSQCFVPILAFDFKGDLGADSAGEGYHLDEIYEAETLEPPRSAIPLDVLHLQDNDEISIAEAASRFRDSFARRKGSRLGDKQRTAVHDAASRALRMNSPCQLQNILDCLEDYYTEHEMKEDGAISAMRELCRFPLFEPNQEPRQFFNRSWLIKLPPNVSEDSRGLVVNLILDTLDQYLNSLPDSDTSPDGSRKLRIICMVDEAHRILGTKLPSLSNLIRMSRSKGGAIMLISQSPDDFSGEDDEFLSEMGLVGAFSTNAPPRNAARILGKGAKLGILKTGECYIKQRGDQTAKKIQAW